MGAGQPQGGEKIGGVRLIGDKLKAHPQAEQEVKFLVNFLLGGECWRVGVEKG